jgi:DNA-binding cell septation regulator SpoVG
MELEILHIKLMESCDKLKAFVDVTIEGEITLKGIRLIEDSKGMWLGFPQNKYVKNGLTKYVPIVEVSSRIAKLIREAALKAYEDAVNALG